MAVRTITKSPAGIEDLTLGDSTENQTRNGTPYVVTQISGASLPFDVSPGPSIKETHDAHLVDPIDAHDASAISYDNTTSGLVAIEVQGAIDEVEGRLDTAETYLATVNDKFEYTKHITPPFDVNPNYTQRAIGTDAHIHVSLSPKGDGSIFFGDTSAIALGYPIGTRCVDMQLSASYGIAGTDSFGAGYSSYTDATSFACGVLGFNVGAGGTGSVALGYAAEAYGQGTVCANKGTVYADGSFGSGLGTIFGTLNKQVHASYASYRKNGIIARAASGVGKSVPTAYTTDVNPVILTTNGSLIPSAAGIDHDGAASTWVKGDSSNVQVIPRSGMFGVTARVIGAQYTGGGLNAVLNGEVLDVEIKATVWRGYLTTDPVTILGTPAVSVITRTSGAASWSATLVVNQTRRSVEIQVVGETSKDIRWVCNFDTVEVG